MDQDGYWLASVVDADGTHDYDDLSARYYEMMRQSRAELDYHIDL